MHTSPPKRPCGVTKVSPPKRPCGVTKVHRPRSHNAPYGTPNALWCAGVDKLYVPRSARPPSPLVARVAGHVGRWVMLAVALIVVVVIAISVIGYLVLQGNPCTGLHNNVGCYEQQQGNQ